MSNRTQRAIEHLSQHGGIVKRTTVTRLLQSLGIGTPFEKNLTVYSHRHWRRDGDQPVIVFQSLGIDRGVAVGPASYVERQIAG